MSSLRPNGNTALIWVMATIVLGAAFIAYVLATGAPS